MVSSWPKLSVEIRSENSARTASQVWSWFKFDVPLRILPLMLLPLIWANVWGGGLQSIGINPDIALKWWLWTMLLAALVFGACLVFILGIGGRGSRPTNRALWLELPFYLFLNPVAEELFFRGWIQPQLGGIISGVPALVLVSIVFGFHHALAGFTRPFLILATIGGILFGVVTMSSGSVIPAIGLHISADIGLFLIGPWWLARAHRRAE